MTGSRREFGFHDIDSDVMEVALRWLAAGGRLGSDDRKRVAHVGSLRLLKAADSLELPSLFVYAARFVLDHEPDAGDLLAYYLPGSFMPSYFAWDNYESVEAELGSTAAYAPVFDLLRAGGEY